MCVCVIWVLKTYVSVLTVSSFRPTIGLSISRSRRLVQGDNRWFSGAETDWLIEWFYIIPLLFTFLGYIAFCYVFSSSSTVAETLTCLSCSHKCNQEHKFIHTFPKYVQYLTIGRSHRRGPGCPGWCLGRCGDDRSGSAPGCLSAHPGEQKQC